MNDKDRYEAFARIQDTTYRWVLAMDAKASFLSALNLGVCIVLWSGTSKFPSASAFANLLAVGATAFAAASIITGITVVSPRTQARQIFRKAKPAVALAGESPSTLVKKSLLFYGHVAERSQSEFDAFYAEISALEHEALSRELVLDHFVNSHVVQQKAERLRTAALLLACAVFMMITALCALAVLRTYAGVF